jgi:RNA polymerase sigma factor (sigma-70 family)
MCGKTPTISIEELLRQLAPRVLGAVLRRYRDFARAEDAVQESLLAAVRQWPAEGLPANPYTWLVAVALRRMVDQVRSESARRRREDEMAEELARSIVPGPGEARPCEEDDTLALLFLCCHPALTGSSSIALTLRAVGGLTTGEIAHAFLVPESTMAQRIARAKQSIRDSGIPFEIPTPDAQAQRLGAVLHVLYLIFNEGYTSTNGSALRRDDLATEAIRLTRMIHDSLPDSPEVSGLLSLMLLTDARRAARTSSEGELIPLTQQDRTLWKGSQIAEGIALLSSVLPKRMLGRYQLQAAIAALHDEAARAEDTDWPQILLLYELLLQMADDPSVRLNHAIATAMVHGPEKGLKLLDALATDPRLMHQQRIDAARGHMLEMAGDLDGAAAQDRIAAAKTANLAERNYLLARAADLEELQTANSKGNACR